MALSSKPASTLRASILLSRLTLLISVQTYRPLQIQIQQKGFIPFSTPKVPRFAVTRKIFTDVIHTTTTILIAFSLCTVDTAPS